MPYKNPDGTFNHFEMKGGIFAGWEKNLSRLDDHIASAIGVFEDIAASDINATAMVEPLLRGLDAQLTHVLDSMRHYRLEAFGQREEE